MGLIMWQWGGQTGVAAYMAALNASEDGKRFSRVWVHATGTILLPNSAAKEYRGTYTT